MIKKNQIIDGEINNAENVLVKDKKSFLFIFYS